MLEERQRARSVGIRSWADIWHETWAHTRTVYLETYIADCLVWPALQWLNFSYVPLRYQVLYVNGCNLLWNSFLSLVRHKGARRRGGVGGCSPQPAAHHCRHAPQHHPPAPFHPTPPHSKLADTFRAEGEEGVGREVRARRVRWGQQRTRTNTREALVGRAHLYGEGLIRTAHSMTSIPALASSPLSMTASTASRASASS